MVFFCKDHVKAGCCYYRRKDEKCQICVVVPVEGDALGGVFAADFGNGWTMAFEAGAAHFAALLVDRAASVDVAVFQDATGLPEDVTDLALAARTARLQSREIDDIDLVVFLLGPAFGKVIGFVVIAFHGAGFTVADVLAMAAEHFLTNGIGGPFVSGMIAVLTKDFRTEIADQGVGFLFAVTIVQIVEVLRGIYGQRSAGTSRGLELLVVIQRKELAFVPPQEYRAGIGIGDVFTNRILPCRYISSITSELVSDPKQRKNSPRSMESASTVNDEIVLLRVRSSSCGNSIMK